MEKEIETPAPRLIGLKTPLILDVMPMEGGEDLLDAMLEAASTMGTRLTLRLEEVERFGSRIGDRIKCPDPPADSRRHENLLREKVA